jgi:predicted ABC-type transport system involved in lysophospholipase L1 biosynthesis ATPase subunit
MIAGIDRPTSGEVGSMARPHELDENQRHLARANMGIIFHSSNCSRPQPGAERDLRWTWPASTGAPNAVSARVLLDLVGLADRCASCQHGLGGQQQRAASGHRQRPSVIIADERPAISTRAGRDGVRPFNDLSGQGKRSSSSRMTALAALPDGDHQRRGNRQ